MRLRSAWLGLGWLGVAGVVVLSLIPAPPTGPEHGDKLGHAGSYALLMWWFAQAWVQRDARALRSGKTLALNSDREPAVSARIIERVMLELFEKVAAEPVDHRATDPLGFGGFADADERGVTRRAQSRLRSA